MRCNARVLEQQCDQVPVYRIWMIGCEHCCVTLGQLFCSGHKVCVEHAAGIRAGAYKYLNPHTDADADAERLRSLA